MNLELLHIDNSCRSNLPMLYVSSYGVSFRKITGPPFVRFFSAEDGTIYMQFKAADGALPLRQKQSLLFTQSKKIKQGICKIFGVNGNFYCPIENPVYHDGEKYYPVVTRKLIRKGGVK
jgi:hypothetical protein